jgi:hypothetical protein
VNRDAQERAQAQSDRLYLLQHHMVLMAQAMNVTAASALSPIDTT